MRFIKSILVVILVFGVLVLPGTDETSKKRMERTIRFLADDLLEGRGTPSRGLDIAALYLANELREMGWQPANGTSYYQTYKVNDFSPQQARYNIYINGIQLDADDYIFSALGMDPARTPKEYDLVFAGYGIFAPERGVDDFKDLDLENKAVISYLGAPWELDPHGLFAYDRAIGKSVHVTVRKGSLLVYVSEELETPPGSSPGTEIGLYRLMSQLDRAYLPEFQGKPTCGISPMLIISPRVFDKTLAKITGNNYKDWKRLLAEGKFKGCSLSAKLNVHIDVKPRKGKASNVVALMHGADSSLKDEWVVLTAHYDHLGYRDVPEGQDGIWNGADDNASGTAAVLEIARQLGRGKPPRRSVLVFLTSGEEQGLLGTAHYARHPLVPYNQVIVNINVDMVGRSTGSVGALTPGSKDLFNSTFNIGKEMGVRVKPDTNPSWRLIYFVDSYHFARFDVPIIEFFTVLHKDYHQPTDEIQLVRFEELARIFEVMYKLTDYYAQGGQKPTFQRPEWFLTVD